MDSADGALNPRAWRTGVVFQMVPESVWAIGPHQPFVKVETDRRYAANLLHRPRWRHFETVCRNISRQQNHYRQRRDDEAALTKALAILRLGIHRKAGSFSG